MNNQILIDPQRNTVLFPDGTVYEFSHRWEATLLILLLAQDRTNQALRADILDNELHQRGQSKPLNRSQHGRLIKSLSNALGKFPGQPLTLEHGPRNATVGPWRIRLNSKFEAITTDESGITPATELWAWPRLLEDPNEEMLRDLLAACLVSDTMAIHGSFHDATDSLYKVFSYPLTSDTNSMLLLRDSRNRKLAGEFEEARAIIREVLAVDESKLHDPGLIPMARFLLNRIDYDEDPGTAHHRLWELDVELTPIWTCDQRITPEWHNLRALLLRRRIMGIFDGSIVAQPSEDVGSLHRRALLHLETAIYFCLALRDWERLQAFVGNYAYHLHVVLPLGLATVPLIFSWYALMMNYAEKIDAGRDTAWEYIFLGELWLDNEDELKRYSKATHNLTTQFLLDDNLNPEHESFYRRGVDRLLNCADGRQVAIAWINYDRFARRHLPSEKQREVRKELCRVLDGAVALRTTLAKEGYAEHLPL